MKLLTTTILILTIIKHLISGTWDGRLLLELLAIALFYFLGRQLWKQYKWSSERRKALKQGRTHRNPKEIKTWRSYQSNTQISNDKEWML